MQRVINYGSFLQAYALKRIVESLGADCYFIDIEKGRQLPGNEVDSKFNDNIKRIFRIVSNLIKNPRQTFMVRKFSKTLRHKFINQYYDILLLDKKYNGMFDVVIIGSDEVFNCTQKCDFGFSRQLFGSGINAKKIISYAASFGNTTAEKIKKYGLQQELSGYLDNNFSAISIRDLNSKTLVETFSHIKPELHLDPVLIYNFKKEIQNLKVNHKDYIVIYTYVNRIQDIKEIEAIRSFAKKYNKKLISIFCAYSWCDEYIVPETPFDVLAYFRDADYIITDTFHGTIFSIINKKQFGTIVRESNKEKLTSLLSTLFLSDRIIDRFSLLEAVLTNIACYDKASKEIEKEKINTSQYFKNNI